MSTREPATVLWDLLRGAMTTKALGLVADLRIADQLADGPLPVAELAERAGVDADGLRRVLRALASDGVFAEEEAGVFRNTEASELLRRPGWSEFAHLFGGVFYRAVDDLESAARSGKPSFPDKFGADFWSWLGERSKERAVFDRAMAGEKRRSAERLAELEWRADETVVDVGGGNGALLVELFRGQPALRGIVFDLPETERDESSLGDRIDFVAGSFFDGVPAGGTYVLSGILHDWDDERASAILRTVRAAAPSDARVLILESVVPVGNEPEGSKWLDLLMLVLAGGRERTAEEWRALLEGAGFRPERIEDGLIEATCP
jgi:DNA-binding Lrp family transcriptional regulator